MIDTAHSTIPKETALSHQQALAKICAPTPKQPLARKCTTITHFDQLSWSRLSTGHVCGDENKREDMRSLLASGWRREQLFQLVEERDGTSDLSVEALEEVSRMAALDFCLWLRLAHGAERSHLSESLGRVSLRTIFFRKPFGVMQDHTRAARLAIAFYLP
jgi:hypothetical protein